MRHKHFGIFTDGNGQVVGSSTTSDANAGTVSVYLAGTTTAADVYEDSAGGSAVNSVSTDAYGYFEFWVDDFDYPETQLFKITLSHADFESKTYDYIRVIRNRYEADATATDQGAATSNANESLNDLIEGIGTSEEATLKLPHSGTGNTTTYTLTTPETLPTNFSLEIGRGAVLDGAGTLTLNSPDQIKAGLYQIFGSSITVTFSSAGTVYPEWWGADNSAAADSATAFNSAMTSLSAGGIVDGKRTFRADSTLSIPSNVMLDFENGTIDFSNASNGDYLFHVLGSQDGTPRDLTGDASAGDDSISVATASTYFNAGDWTIVRDDTVWDLADSGTVGEWVYIHTANASDVDLGNTLLYGYETADNAVLDIMSLKTKIHIKGGKFTGSGASGGQYGFIAQWASDVTIENCEFIDFENTAIALYRTVQFSIKNNIIRNSHLAGYGYGIITGGCAYGEIEYNKIENGRVGIDCGGASLLPSRFIDTHHNKIVGCKDFGIETHGMADYLTISYNKILSGRSDGAIQTGIRYFGTNGTIDHNEINGCERQGILFEPSVDNGDAATFAVITDNKVLNCGATDSQAGILVHQDNVYSSDVPFDGIHIKNNIVDTPGTHGIFVYADRAVMTNVFITGNEVKGITGANVIGIWVYGLTGETITNGTVSNNIVVRTDDLDACIELQHADAGGISYFSLVGNSLNNGSYGILGTNTNYVACVGNTSVGATDGFSIAGAQSVDANNAEN